MRCNNTDEEDDDDDDDEEGVEEEVAMRSASLRFHPDGDALSRLRAIGAYSYTVSQGQYYPPLHLFRLLLQLLYAAYAAMHCFVL